MSPRVIGLDPGSHNTGYAVVEPGKRLCSFKLLACGVIKAPGKKPLAARLKVIFEELNSIIKQTTPHQMAVEGIFSHQNAKTALILGHARGAALLSASLAGLEVYEYTPTAVKKALVGNGRATKEQVRAMTSSLVGQNLNLSLDATDALGIAITHLHTRKVAALMDRLR